MVGSIEERCLTNAHQHEAGEAEGTSPLLPSKAIVIRGGVMEPRTMEINAYTAYDETGEYSLSVASLPEADIDTIARVANLPYPQVRVSSVGRIRAAGYEVVPSEPPPAHADLRLGGIPTDQDW